MIRRRKWLLLAIVVLIPAAVYAVSLMLPDTYRSTTTLLLQPTGSGAAAFSAAPNNTSSAEETATLARTTLVANRAARILRRPRTSGRALLDKIEVSLTSPGEAQAKFLTIAALASSPALAARIANAFARALAKTRTANAIASIDRTIATLRQTRRDLVGDEDDPAKEELAEQIQRLRGLKASQAGTTTVVEKAVPAASPYSPKPLRNALLALLVAALVAVGIVPLLNRLDHRLRNTDELEELIEAPLLAAVPNSAFPGRRPDWHTRETFQTLRANLTYFNIDRPLSTLVVSSPAQWDGKTTVAVNLAVAYAMDGADVILMDADLRHPQVASRLGNEVAVGLETVLVGERPLEQALIDVDAGGGRLRVLAGAVPPPNPAALLGSHRMSALIAELTEKAGVVIIDTPAMLAVSDAIPLVNLAAGTVLVARLDKTTREAVIRTAQVIEAAGGALLGTVATGADAGDEYGYYGYYGYQAESSTPSPRVTPSSPNGSGDASDAVPRGARRA